MSFLGSPRFLEMISSMRAGTLRSNEEILGELTGTGLEDEEAVIRATQLGCELLTKLSFVYFINVIGQSHWRSDLFAKPESNNLMCRLASPVEFYVFELYEQNFGSTRETILHLDSLKPPHAVPYLEVFLRNAIKNMYGASEQVPTRENILKLFGPEKPLLRWCELQIRQGRELKHFGGQTNTRVGLYAQLFHQIPSLKSQLIERAGANFDLGGGFSTPEISTVLNREFTSLDLIPPMAALEWNLQFGEMAKSPSASSDAEYLEALRNQKYLPFDVFTTDFPTDFSSYNICSFGFMNSTVNSLSGAQPAVDPALRKFSTTFHALWRVVRLASLGKQITLLTFGRPDSNYMNRCVVMRFREGRVESVHVPDHFMTLQPFARPTYLTHKISRDEMRQFTASLESGRDQGVV